MSHWIFIVKEQKEENKSISGRDVFTQRMEDGFWGLDETAPNRNNIQPKDKIVFYLAAPDKVFAGTATTISPCFKLSPDQREFYSHDLPFFNTDYGIKLDDVDIWKSPKFVPDMVNNLVFIKNKKNWGSYFQGSVRRIPPQDFNTIVSSNVTQSHTFISQEDELIESTSQFALESHLEEFIHANWAKMNWGRSLRLYETPSGEGRQFPAGKWSIDFLAIDNETNDLVVVELKKSKTSDATIGQIQRYMGWVREHIAEKGQNVKGIVICHEIDDSLRYGVHPSGEIEVLTYKVKFELTPMDQS